MTGEAIATNILQCWKAEGDAVCILKDFHKAFNTHCAAHKLIN